MTGGIDSAAFLFSERAERDLAGIIRWFEAQEPGLAADFAGELDRTLARIAFRPESFQRIEGGIRRAVVHRFPYLVAYEKWQDRIYILRIRDCRRDPKSLLSTEE